MSVVLLNYHEFFKPMHSLAVVGHDTWSDCKKKQHDKAAEQWGEVTKGEMSEQQFQFEFGIQQKALNNKKNPTFTLQRNTLLALMGVCSMRYFLFHADLLQ